jgi:hypothetical protein
MAELQSPARAQIWGVRKGRKCPSRLWARRMRLEIWAVQWGRSAGARCVTRRQPAWAACVRQVGCATEWCSPPQPATLRTTARVSTSSRVRRCVFMLPTAHCPPDHLDGLSEGGSPSTHSTRKAFLRSLEQKVRRLLHAAAGRAERIGDRRRRHRRENHSKLCECLRTQDSQSRATERAQPHSSALASRRRVPSLLGNGPHRLLLRRRRHLRRRSVRRDWQRLRRGLRTQHAARW